jgi:hypothetical protein
MITLVIKTFKPHFRFNINGGYVRHCVKDSQTWLERAVIHCVCLVFI